MVVDRHGNSPPLSSLPLSLSMLSFLVGVSSDLDNADSANTTQPQKGLVTMSGPAARSTIYHDCDPTLAEQFTRALVPGALHVFGTPVQETAWEQAEFEGSRVGGSGCMWGILMIASLMWRCRIGLLSGVGSFGRLEVLGRDIVLGRDGWGLRLGFWGSACWDLGSCRDGGGGTYAHVDFVGCSTRFKVGSISLWRAQTLV